jgi:uncharacterized protein
VDVSLPVLILLAAVMAVGLFGTVVPLLPGLSLIWTAALAYGLIGDFGSAGWIAMTAITLFLAAGTVAKFVLPQRRVAAGGAPRSTLMVGAAAGLVGFFALPVVGLPVGAVLGVLAAEYRRTKDWSPAWRSTKHVIVGFGLGALVELGAGVAMIGCWVAWVLAQR